MKEILKILNENWEYGGAIRNEPQGGSRKSFQLDNLNWITQCDLKNYSQFKRETDLIKYLTFEINNSIRPPRTPELVQTINGNDLVIFENSIYRITKNIEGKRVNPSDWKVYFYLVKALSCLHHKLSYVPLDMAVLNEGIVESIVRINVDDFHSDVFKILHGWLVSQIDHLLHHPIQITHGDFNPSNILCSDFISEIKINGIIDFELSRPDPIIMDNSQLFTMIVCHSKFDNKRESINELILLMDSRFSELELSLAAVAYWLDLYNKWKLNQTAEQKILFRLGQIKDFLEI